MRATYDGSGEENTALGQKRHDKRQEEGRRIRKRKRDEGADGRGREQFGGDRRGALSCPELSLALLPFFLPYHILPMSFLAVRQSLRSSARAFGVRRRLLII
jgi:hypothetical protein